MKIASRSPLSTASLICAGGALATASWGTAVLVFTGVNLPIAFLGAGTLFAVYDALHRRSVRIRVTLLGAAACALASWAALSITWSASPDATISVSYYYATCWALLVLVRHHCTDVRALVLLGAAFLLGCLVSFGLLVDAWSAGRAFTADRYSVQGVNANHIAYSLVTGIAVGVALWSADGVSRRHRLILGGCMLAFAIGVFLTGSRSGFVAIIAVGAGLGAATLRKPTLRAAVLLICAALAGVALYGQLPEGSRVRLTSFTDPSFDPAGKNDWSGRLGLWPRAIELIEEAPTLGHGAGAFAALNPLGAAAHNVFLSVTVELGVIGLILYGLVLWGAFGWIRERRWSGVTRAVGLAFLAGWFAIALAGAWDVTMVAWFGFAWASRLPEVLARADRGVAAERRDGGAVIARRTREAAT